MAIFQGFNTYQHPSSGLSTQLEKLDAELVTQAALMYPVETIHCRPCSGNGSQIQSHRSVWTAPFIAEWAGLKADHDLQLKYVVNFNNTPEIELAFFEQLELAGVVHSEIELGNEHYLKKYSDPFGSPSNASKPEVTVKTASMTPTKYIEYCEEYITVFAVKALPFLMQLAPNGKGTNSQKSKYNNWNTYVINAVENTMPAATYHYSQHIYSPIDDEYDLSALTATLTEIGGSYKMYITEYGARPDTGVTEAVDWNLEANRELLLAQNIKAVLRNNDVMMTHMFWNNYLTEAGRHQAAYWNDETNPKGVLIIPFVFDQTLPDPIDPAGDPLLVSIVFERFSIDSWAQTLYFDDDSTLYYYKENKCDKKTKVDIETYAGEPKSVIIEDFFDGIFPAEPV